MLQYPKHFYDPLRIEIATIQIQHDLRKLLPSLDRSNWDVIDHDVAEWPDGERFEMETLHDFWNFFDGFSRGLKLKSLINWITASNVEWSKEEIPLDEAIIIWDFPGLEFMGSSPYKIFNVKKYLQKICKDGKMASLITDSEFRSNRFPPRDYFRIIVIEDKQGKILGNTKGFYVLEGNRRTIRAMLHDQKYISAYVGRLEKDALWPENYWIRTGTLRDLVFLAHYYNLNKDEHSLESVRKFYQLLLRDFDIVQKTTASHVFKYIEKDDKFLNEIFTKELK